MLEYSYLKDIYSKSIVDECFNIENSITRDYDDIDNLIQIVEKEDLIDEKDRKFISCSAIGMLGKFKNTRYF